MTINNYFILFILLLLCLTSCYFNSTPLLSPEAMPEPVEQISKRILLYIPIEFSQFAYTGAHDYRKISFEYGPGATAALKYLFGKSFKCVDIRGITSEVEFYSNINNESFWNEYEYAVLPKIITADSYVVPFKIGVRIVILIDFISSDRLRNITIKGEGEGSSSIYTDSELDKAGKKALELAFKELRNDLSSKRSMF